MPKWHEVFDILKGPLSTTILGVIAFVIFMFNSYWKLSEIFRPILGWLSYGFAFIISILFLLISYGYIGAKYYNKGSSKPAKYALAIYFLITILILLLVSVGHPEWGSSGQFFFNFIIISVLIIATAIGYLLAKFAKLSVPFSDYKIAGIFFIIVIVILALEIFLPAPAQTTPQEFVNSFELVNYSIHSIHNAHIVWGIRESEKPTIVEGTFYFHTLPLYSFSVNRYDIYLYPKFYNSSPIESLSLLYDRTNISKDMGIPITKNGTYIIICTPDGNICSNTPIYIPAPILDIDVSNENMYYEFSHNLQEITHTINVKNNNDFSVDVGMSYLPEYINEGSCRKYDYIGQEIKTIEPYQNATFHLNIEGYAGSCDAEQMDSMKGTYKGKVALVVGDRQVDSWNDESIIWKYIVPYTVVLK